MAHGPLSDALKEFDLAIDDLTGNFDFVRSASRLRPRLGGMLNWEFLDADAKSLATKFLQQQNAQESLLYRSMVISLAGAFEQFVRRVLQDSVRAISGDGISYDALDDQLKKENIHRTGAALQTVREPLDYLNFDYEQLAKNLGTCVSGSGQAVLNAEAFAFIVSVISPEALGRALARIGIDFQLDAFGRLPEFQHFFGKNKTRETSQAISDLLKRFGQMRNKIAHTGSGGIVVTESEFEQLVLFFRAFVRALVSLTESKLSKHLKK